MLLMQKQGATSGGGEKFPPSSVRPPPPPPKGGCALQSAKLGRESSSDVCVAFCLLLSLCRVVRSAAVSSESVFIADYVV